MMVYPPLVWLGWNRRANISSAASLVVRNSRALVPRLQGVMTRDSMHLLVCVDMHAGELEEKNDINDCLPSTISFQLY